MKVASTIFSLLLVGGSSVADAFTAPTFATRAVGKAPPATRAVAKKKAPVKKVAAKKAAAKAAPAAPKKKFQFGLKKAAPAKAAPAKKVAVKKAPVKKAAPAAPKKKFQFGLKKAAPAKKVAVKKAPVKKAPVKKAPVKKAAPAKKAAPKKLGLANLKGATSSKAPPSSKGYPSFAAKAQNFKLGRVNGGGAGRDIQPVFVHPTLNTEPVPDFDYKEAAKARLSLTSKNREYLFDDGLTILERRQKSTIPAFLTGSAKSNVGASEIRTDIAEDEYPFGLSADRFQLLFITVFSLFTLVGCLSGTVQLD